ncbi:MAG TPA: phosphotransferase [Candidatus Dormibacteraeota bacterium]|nr:phosphotransferase [Candidatus Dormibacteraeota bacterium]
MREATSTDAVTDFARQVLNGTGWELAHVSRRFSRLEPPHSYWVVFEITTKKDEAEDKFRLVARGAFDPGSWSHLKERLEREGGGRPCDPIEHIGYPHIVEDSQLAFWFYPFDLALPGLPSAADAKTMWTVLSNLTGRQIDRLHVERVRYVPEISGILRYDLDEPGGVTSAMYGKVQPGDRGLRTYRIEEALWQRAMESGDLLKIAKPEGFIPEYGMLLEGAAPGKPVKGDRDTVEFFGVGRAAAEALAVIHESGLEPDEQVELEAELSRLDSVAEQFAYVDPKAHFLLSELVLHLRDRLSKTYEEEWLPTHADLKYDQFLHEDGRYTLIDFDYFAMAETSYDLAKFCAYAIPSAPRGWEDTVAAEATRRAFLSRYRELRPYATLDRFQIYEALILALRAMTVMWSQHHGWENAAEVFLVMAQERLNTRLPEAM